jgi:hypothetical protein
VFRVEILRRSECGDTFAETANIPCAATVEDATRIIHAWLAARCPILIHVTHAKLLNGDEEVWSQEFPDRLQG